jgi:hypothetical protein
MRKALVLATLTIAVFAATVWHGRPTFSFAAAERVRLQAHFDSVERELRARDVPELTPAQRAARGRLMDILHSYQVRGVFPRNTDFPDRDMPVFIDWWGKRCGFAYLIEQTGNEDLVLRIAATRNNARASELKDDPAVRRWLAANGITLAEAARIQPSYGCGTVHAPPTCPGSAYQVASAVAVFSNVAVLGLNLVNTDMSRHTGGILALGTGVLGIAVGAPNLGSAGDRGTWGALSTGLGAVSLVVGAFRLGTPGEGAAQSRVSVGPWLGARGASGPAARVTF